MSEAGPAPRRGVNVKDATTALVLLAIIATAWIASADYAREARMFPRIALGAMAILSLALLTRSLMGVRIGEFRPFFRHAPTFVVCLALILIYITAAGAIGYFSASAILLPVFALALGLRRPWLIGLATLGFIVAVHLVFVESFERPLPTEFFERF